MGDAIKRPRVTLTDLDTTETLELPLIPTQLDHSTSAKWTNQVIPGLSHEVLQFSNTANAGFTFDAYFDACDGFTSVDQLVAARDWLESTQYPSDRPQDPGGPSKYLFVWPGLCSVIVIVNNISFSLTRFQEIDGRLSQFTAKVAIQEARKKFLSRDLVRSRGLRRGA